MKKKVTSLLLSTSIIAALLAGCGSSASSSESLNSTDSTSTESATETSTDPEATSSGDVIEINWMHKFIEPGVLKWVDESISNFEAANPGITINSEAIPQDDYEQMLKTRISSDDAPDIFVLDNQSRYQEYSEAGRLLDISDLEGLSNIKDDMLKDGQVNGVQYAVPLDVNAYAVHYNKDIFEEYNLEVPTTIDDLRNVCKTLQDNGIQPFATGYGTLYLLWFGVEAFMDPMAATTPNWFTDKMELKSNFADDQNFRDAITEWYSLKEYWGDDPWGLDADTCLNNMANGDAAMMMNGSWTVDGINSINPDVNLGIFGMPTFDEKDSSKIIMKPGAGICLYNNTNDPARLDAAKKFFNYLLSEECGNLYAKDAFKISTLKSADVSFSSALTDAVSYSDDRVWTSAGTTQFTSEYETAFYDTVQKYGMEDSLDIDAMCKELDEDFAAITK